MATPRFLNLQGQPFDFRLQLPVQSDGLEKSVGFLSSLSEWTAAIVKRIDVLIILLKIEWLVKMNGW